MICNAKAISYLCRKIKDNDDNNEKLTNTIVRNLCSYSYNDIAGITFLEKLNSILKNTIYGEICFDILAISTQKYFFPIKKLETKHEDYIDNDWYLIVNNWYLIVTNGDFSPGLFGFDYKIKYNKVNLYGFIFFR